VMAMNTRDFFALSLSLSPHFPVIKPDSGGGC
jgi:hypothetical protein